MKKEKAFRDEPKKVFTEALKPDGSAIRRAIADGFGEYRRLIDGIRLRTGRQSRRSLLTPTN